MAKDLILTQGEYKLFLHRIRGHNGQKPNRPPVRQEGTGERDAILSELHRQWGYDVPACDIDFIEYDQARPNALIEYKKRKDWQTTPLVKNANLKVLIALGNRAKLPVFCVFYPENHSMFRVVSVNDYAKTSQKAMWAWDNTLLKS